MAMGSFGPLNVEMFEKDILSIPVSLFVSSTWIFNLVIDTNLGYFGSMTFFISTTITKDEGLFRIIESLVSYSLYLGIVSKTWASLSPN